MSGEAQATILDRHGGRALMHEHFASQLRLLEELANYGSYLILRAFDSSDKQLADVIICTVLLKQVVAMLDAVHILCEAGAIYAAYLPGRAAFEASVYIEWIIAGDSDQKAHAYIVANYREERLWARRAIAGTAERSELEEIASASGLSDLRPPTSDEEIARNHLAEVDRILGQPEFRPIDLEFDRLRKKRNHDVAWYELLRLSSFRKAAEAVGRSAEYQWFYGKGSQIVHAGSHKHHIKFAPGRVRIGQVRSLTDFRELLTFVALNTTRTYRKVLQHYRPEELENFARKYKEEWKNPFNATRDVRYADE